MAELLQLLTPITINSVFFFNQVSNSAGSDSAKGEIKVLDRPEPPEGLTASVDGDKCVLMWKRSKDDGGAPIEHYQVCSMYIYGDTGCGVLSEGYKIRKAFGKKSTVVK